MIRTVLLAAAGLLLVSLKAVAQDPELRLGSLTPGNRAVCGEVARFGYSVAGPASCPEGTAHGREHVAAVRLIAMISGNNCGVNHIRFTASVSIRPRTFRNYR